MKNDNKISVLLIGTFKKENYGVYPAFVILAVMDKAIAGTKLLVMDTDLKFDCEGNQVKLGDMLASRISATDYSGMTEMLAGLLNIEIGKYAVVNADKALSLIGNTELVLTNSELQEVHSNNIFPVFGNKAILDAENALKFAMSDLLSTRKTSRQLRLLRNTVKSVKYMETKSIVTMYKELSANTNVGLLEALKYAMELRNIRNKEIEKIEISDISELDNINI